LENFKGDFLNILTFFAASDSRFSNSCISTKYCPILTNHTSMEPYLFSFQIIYKSQFQKFFTLIRFAKLRGSVLKSAHHYIVEKSLFCFFVFDFLLSVNIEKCQDFSVGPSIAIFYVRGVNI